jgi:hypothetical protein
LEKRQRGSKGNRENEKEEGQKIEEKESGYRIR